MKNVEEFLAHTIQLESEAALRFGQLADAMTTVGNKQVGKLFRRLADYSLLHLGDAKARAGFRTLPEMQAGDYRWPDIESPEAAAIWAADPFIGIEQALQVALDAETAGLNFYADVLENTQDSEIQVLAKEFVEEESQHVAELKRWIQLHLSGQPLPTEA
jgi:rubrerythrin